MLHQKDSVVEIFVSLLFVQNELSTGFTFGVDYSCAQEDLANLELTKICYAGYIAIKYFLSALT